MSSIQLFSPTPYNSPPKAHRERLASITYLVKILRSRREVTTAPANSPMLRMLTIHEYHVSFNPSPGCTCNKYSNAVFNDVEAQHPRTLGSSGRVLLVTNWWRDGRALV